MFDLGCFFVSVFSGLRLRLSCWELNRGNFYVAWANKIEPF